MTPLRDLTLGRYLPGDSLVHRLDPRAKLLACLLVLAGSFVAGSGWGLFACWPLLVYGVHRSSIPAATFFRGLRPFVWLFAFTILLHGLTTPGVSVGPFPLLGVDLTGEGLLRGAAFAAQLATAIGYSSLLTLTTDPVELVWGMEHLLRPLAWARVPVEEFCFTLLIALQFFPILQEEVEAASGEAGAGEMPPRGPFARARRLGLLSGELFRNTLARAETVGRALEARIAWPAAPSTRGFGAPEWGMLGLGTATLVWVYLTTTGGGVS